MLSGVTRRHFLRTGGAATLAALSIPRLSWAKEANSPPFRISLAEWSLHRTIRSGKITNLDFPVVARKEFGIEAIEYVNSFFKSKARDETYLGELKDRCDSEGVRSLVIMCDGEGRLGDPDDAARSKAVENHHRWVEAARFLGCHSIRVNASSSGSFQEQQKLVADGLSRLGEFADTHAINVLVENHGGLSSNGAWLAGIMKQVARPNVGTLPDFGNFCTKGRPKGPNEKQVWYDRYQGTTELMPYAKAVSAKSYGFDSEGNETTIDYFQMLKIVLEAGYQGFVGIEWEGDDPGEYEGVRLTKKLLERVRDGLA